uniref:BED-type domain-containing protein n=1 Tax=Anopheles christyi TaxID=43041 RepID=A0A182KG07_9DIPT
MKNNKHQQHFEHQGTGAKCRYCRNIFAFTTGSTVNLKRHMLPTIKRQLDVKLLLMVCKGYNPFSIVEEKAFKDFILSLQSFSNSKYELPSRPTLTNAIFPSVYDELLVTVKDKLATSTKVALTTNKTWTNLNTVSFLAVTSHFIDQNGKLCSLLLDCSIFCESHTGKNI